jgi:hypothetical protein
MFNVYKNQVGKQEVGIWQVQKCFPQYGVPIWSLWPRSDIWSQASYRYPISWEALLDPSDSYFLFADFVDFYAHWTYMIIFRRIFLSNYWWQESDIYPMGLKMLPTIWGTYMKLVTKHQISAINSCWEKCDEKCAYMFNVYKNQSSRQRYTVFPLSVLPSVQDIFRHIFLSNCWWQKSDIWSQASYNIKAIPISIT